MSFEYSNNRLTNKVEVGLPAERVRDEPDHAVQREAALDDGAGLAQRRHVRVHAGVHQPERYCFVAYQRLGDETTLLILWERRTVEGKYFIHR